MRVTWAPRLSIPQRPLIEQDVIARPDNHLWELPSGTTGSLKPFVGRAADIQSLYFAPVDIRDWSDKNRPLYRTLLGAIETDGETTPLPNRRPWIYSNGRVIELIEQKWMTLPAEYIQDEALYEMLSSLTYRFTIRWIQPPMLLSDASPQFI